MELKIECLDDFKSKGKTIYLFFVEGREVLTRKCPLEYAHRRVPNSLMSKFVELFYPLQL